MKLTSSLAALSVSLLTSLVEAQAPNYPPHLQSANFYLVANVTGDDVLGIQNYVLTSYHIGAGMAYAVLQENTTAGIARDLFINGTGQDVYWHRSTLMSDSGTPPTPVGVEVDSEAVEDNGGHAVFISVGNATPGVGLSQFPEPIPYLVAPSSGIYYACYSNLTSGDAYQLFVRYADEELPKTCSDVTLLPQCSVGDGVEHKFNSTVNCYPDVAAINWATVF